MVTKLDDYNRKRDFPSTSEPEGIPAETGEQLRFLVHHHVARNDHFDLRLEWDGTLLSWAVPKGPSLSTRDKRLAIHVEDHPLEYRNFEGTIPKGEYGGGTVMLWDEGYWEPFVDVDKGLANGMLKFSLVGRRLKGKWALVQMKSKDDRNDNWLLLKERDKYASTDSTDGGISEFVTSIRTGRTMKEIENGRSEKIVKNPFQSADVQLAKLMVKVPEDGNWLYELKYDGYRILAFIEGNSVKLVTRNRNDYTNKFRTVASSLLDLAGGRAMVLDGEMTVSDASGRTDFQALQNYLKNPQSHNLIYILFDILALDGVDLRNLPLSQRKEALLSLMKGDTPKNLHYSQHVEGNGEESLRAACELNMEGIIGKKADSLYTGTRSGDWIKLKCSKQQDFIIGGYSLSDKKARGISSLLLGVIDEGELLFIGRAGSGLSNATIKDLEARFSSIKRSESPFINPPKPKANETLTWVEPILSADIKFSEWTNDNLLRHASFRGLSSAGHSADSASSSLAGSTASIAAGLAASPSTTDRSSGLPSGLAINPSTTDHSSGLQAGLTASHSTGGAVDPAIGKGLIVEGVKISNPQKIIYEDLKITKGDVVNYYSQVAERMLPYLEQRILSAVRCPKGVNQACFYKKHPGPESKGVVTVPLEDDTGKTDDYFYIDSKTGLISEAQMGTVEFHIRGSRVGTIEAPDMMVFDLDPDEGMNIEQVRQGAKDIRAILTELTLNSYIKTSGGKGYHVVVPLKPTATWDTFYSFARSVAEVLEKKWPERYTTNSRKSNRTEKIFIDWMRNSRGATSVAPYSLRAREGAAVSMPISWEELDSIAPDGISMYDALKRIQTYDPWEGFFDSTSYLS
jgi:bifunctional non-homologous end joining protein LigD